MNTDTQHLYCLVDEAVNFNLTYVTLKKNTTNAIIQTLCNFTCILIVLQLQNKEVCLVILFRISFPDNFKKSVFRTETLIVFRMSFENLTIPFDLFQKYHRKKSVRICQPNAFRVPENEFWKPPPNRPGISGNCSVKVDLKI